MSVYSITRFPSRLSTVIEALLTGGEHDVF